MTDELKDKSSMSSETDFLVRGVIKSLNARFSYAETTGTVTDAIMKHDTDPVASHILGSALTVSALAAPLLEGDEKYSFRWEYDGAIGAILTDVSSECDVRGIPRQPHLVDQATCVEELYGAKGTISVIKFETGKVLNSGTAQAGLLDVVDDIGFFFSTSDQLETEFKVVVDFRPDPMDPVQIAAGFMLQAMPDCDLPSFDTVRQRVQQDNFVSLMGKSGLPLETKLIKLLQILLDKEPGEDVSYSFASSPSYTCHCSKEKMKQAVRLLQPEELEEMFENSEHPTVRCQFCNKEYKFTRDDF